jgi:hypothetical protein
MFAGCASSTFVSVVCPGLLGVSWLSWVLLSACSLLRFVAALV